MDKELVGPLILLSVILLFALIAAIGFAISAAKDRKLRRAALAALAQRHGLEFHAVPPGGCLTFGVGTGSVQQGAAVLAEFDRLRPFGVGDRRRVDNLVMGPIGRYRFYAFDYSYETSAGESKKTQRCGIAAMSTPADFRRLCIRPVRFADRLGAAIGLKGIRFESEAFNERYHVTCDDEKFAFDVLNPATIDHLMNVPNRTWQFFGRYAVIANDGEFFPPDDLEQVMMDMKTLLDGIPEYVAQVWGA